MIIKMSDNEDQRAVDKALAGLRSDPEGTDPLLMKHLEDGLQQRQKGFDSGAVQNTYLKDFDIPQIVLFDILANRFPLVVEAQQIVCRALLHQSRKSQQVCIIDLGIGRGVQLLKLLDQLNEKRTASHVTVIGIELIGEALEFCGQRIKEAAERWDFSLDFHPIHLPLEEISQANIQNLIPNEDPFILVNASLSLHHLQKGEERDALFRKVAGWKPQLFTLIEPNTYTFTDDYLQRLPNACEHFSALYHYTNTLPLKEDEKRGLKNFFSNDFFDPIALPDSHRFEKLERGEQWIERAAKSGLKTLPLDPFCSELQIDHIQIEGTPGPFINFKYRNTNLLSIIAFN
jgi:hypothetical protein